METHGDMYQYILDSKDAARAIVDQQEDIFSAAQSYYLAHDVEELTIIGSGTSYHAALAAKPLMEKVLGIRVNTSYPILFKDEILFNNHTMIMGISHAGKSASTIAGLDKARALGLATIALSAEEDATIYAHADCKLPIAIGPESAGPKTKGFIGSIVTLVLFALRIAKTNGKLSMEEYQDYVQRMLQATDEIPNIAEAATKWYEQNKAELLKCRRLYIIGYDRCLAAMMEGTLKILEAVRYSVQGYELEEFMHGIYHAIDQDTYLLYIASDGQYYERILRLKTYFEKERTCHNFLLSSKPQGSTKDMIYPFSADSDFAILNYIIPMQVLARKLSLDLGIDCNIPSDPQFHRKMASYIYEE